MWLSNLKIGHFLSVRKEAFEGEHQYIPVVLFGISVIVSVVVSVVAVVVIVPLVVVVVSLVVVVSTSGCSVAPSATSNY